MIRVIYIDPNNSTAQLTFPLIEVLEKKIDIKFFTSNNRKLDSLYYEIYHIKNLVFTFFNLSNKFKTTKIRQAVKILEYPLNFFVILFKIRTIKPDIIHYNWFFLPIYDYFFIKLIKLLTNAKIIISMHNSNPHERRGMKYFQSKCLSQVDQIIVFSEYIYKSISSITQKSVKVIDHGNGYNKIIKRFNIEPALKKCGDIIKIGFFGLIREYKGVDILIEAFNKVSAVSDFHFELIIKGNCIFYSEKEIEYLVNSSPYRKQITFRNKYLSLEEMSRNIQEVDFVVLPYRQASQSGLIYYYYELKKPLIVTNVGGLKEYIDDKTSLITNPDSESIAKSIISISQMLRENKIQDNFGLFLKDKSFNTVANEYLELYEQLYFIHSS